MSVAEAIRTRRTVRHYLPDPIPETTLDALLGLAIEAPTSWNLQDRSIVAVSEDEGLAGLAWATGGQPQPQEAPVVLVFVAEPQSWRDDHSDVYEQARCSGAWNDEFVAMFSAASRVFQEDLDQRGLLREYAVKDAMIAASFVMLAATEMGLATSPMNGWDEAKVKQVIGIGGRDDLAIALLVSVGYPAEDQRHPGRRARERTVFRESYGADGAGNDTRQE
ncbi:MULTISPECIES: nitroreductase family protein [unclassified Streptomyces]|uniref:nitroreductase family protein n=1 Tax=unclassified Streptomyces TaxID=2593676 RepID=UPI0022519329|nr:nitroreductase family protein [Streptomyces sp. NBC_00047]MCX5610159.1 nitroreductase family protein [Streptomyces sp. NBC_00047]